MRIAILLAALAVGTAWFLGADGGERRAREAVGREGGRVSAATLAPMPSHAPSAVSRLRGRATSSGHPSRWGGTGSSGLHARQTPAIRPQAYLQPLARDLAAPDPVRRMHAIEELGGFAGDGVRLLLAQALARAQSEVEREALKRALASSRRRTAGGPGPGPLGGLAPTAPEPSMTPRPASAKEFTRR